MYFKLNVCVEITKVIIKFWNFMEVSFQDLKNKTDSHYLAKIWSKVALNTITLTLEYH